MSEVGAPTPTTTASNVAVSTPRASPAPKPSTIDRLPTRPETPSTQDVPSENTDSTSPTTPSSVQPPSASTATSSTPAKSAKPALPRTAIPVIPLIPALPKAKSSPKEAKPSPSVESVDQVQKETAAEDVTSQAGAGPTAAKEVVAEEPQQGTAQPAPAPAPAKAPPSSWANLFAKPTASTTSPTTTGQAGTNGVAAEGPNASDSNLSNFVKSNASSVAEVLQAYRVNSVNNLAFLEPRGLINTGNMCYMNSVSAHSPADSATRQLTWSRFCKCFSSVFHSMTSWTRWARRSPTALRARLLWLMRCKFAGSTVPRPFMNNHADVLSKDHVSAGV